MLGRSGSSASLIIRSLTAAYQAAKRIIEGMIKGIIYVIYHFIKNINLLIYYKY